MPRVIASTRVMEGGAAGVGERRWAGTAPKGGGTSAGGAGRRGKQGGEGFFRYESCSRFKIAALSGIILRFPPVGVTATATLPEARAAHPTPNSRSKHSFQTPGPYPAPPAR